MSGGVACICSWNKMRSFDPQVKVNMRKKHWRVYKRNCNYSAFNGYRRTYSAYSSVQCGQCKAMWRTKAEYVNYLEDGELI